MGALLLLNQVAYKFYYIEVPINAASFNFLSMHLNLIYQVVYIMSVGWTCFSPLFQYIILMESLVINDKDLS